MRVLILNTNRDRSPHTVLPLGACHVASAARSAGYDVKLLDLTFSRSPQVDAFETVKKWQPDVTGFSIRNIDNCDMLSPRFCLDDTRQIVEMCRQAGARNLVVGGPAVTTAPCAVLTHLGADWAIVGEGEESFPAFLRALEAKTDPFAIPGVAAVVDGEFRLTQPIAVSNLDLQPPANPNNWLDLSTYHRYDTSMTLQSKRGCPFSCSYCVYPKLEGSGLRLRNPDAVAADVVQAKRLGFRTAEFVDSVFNVPEDHAIACCESIVRSGSKLPLQTLELNPSAYSSDLVEAMNAARFSAVGCTVESASDKVLVSLNKGFDSKKLRFAAQAFSKLDALRLWIFMLGSPGETEATVAETARFIESSISHRDLVYIGVGIRILPRTEIHARSIAEGIVSSDDDLLLPKFYFSRHLTPDKAMGIITGSSFPAANIVSLGDGNGRLLPIFQRLAHTLGISPPYWRFAPIWNRIRQPLRGGRA